MGFVKSLEELAKRNRVNAEFYNAEVLTVFFETKHKVLEHLLPPPLESTGQPLGGIFVANYPETNFGVTYLESALFLFAQHKGDQGLFFLSMPVTDDMALIGGREVFGYPKKMAMISLERRKENVKGTTERHGIQFLEVEAKMTGKFNDENFQAMMTEEMASNPDAVVYNFKYFPSPERDGFDYNPRLIREVVTRKNDIMEMGEAKITLTPSVHDPWSEVEIVRELGAIYTKGNNTMLPGAVVAEVDQMEFLPFAFMKLDEM
jgi:acetoacetate decarboxylase